MARQGQRHHGGLGHLRCFLPPLPSRGKRTLIDPAVTRKGIPDIPLRSSSWRMASHRSGGRDADQFVALENLIRSPSISVINVTAQMRRRVWRGPQEALGLVINLTQ